MIQDKIALSCHIKFGEIVLIIMMNPITIIKREILQATCNRRAWFLGSPNFITALSTRLGRSSHSAMFKSNLISHSCLDSLQPEGVFSFHLFKHEAEVLHCINVFANHLEFHSDNTPHCLLDLIKKPFHCSLKLFCSVYLF